MLKITLNENEKEIEILLEGRIAGPWVAELGRVWVETVPRLGPRSLVLNLNGVTYVDADGMQRLKAIYSLTHAEVIAEALWAKHLAAEIQRAKQTENEEVGYANHG